MLASNSPYRIIVLLMLCVSLFFSACSDNVGSKEEGSEQTMNSEIADKSLPTSTAQTETRSYALAINGKAIPLSEIDKRIELKLFDLEWASYELRKAALSEYLDEQRRLQNVQSVTVMLEPPEPPRIYLSPEQRATAMRFRDSQVSAPILLSVFCNYQSSHCARMQTVYQQIQDEYGALVGFEFYDLPLAFHQFAFSASQAARCAHSMGEFEGFHKALWLNQQSLNEATYSRLAKQLKLNEKQFSACLTAQEHALAIEAQRALASTLGFNQVPVSLVNGLYLNGPKPLEVLRFYIDKELNRLGYQTVPSASAQPDASLEDDKLNAAADNSLDATQAEASAEEQTDDNALPSDMPNPDTLEYKARAVVPAVGEIPLSRDWLEDQLLQQAELESHFQPAEHEVEGVRLTKLTDVQQNEFYQTLGLQEGDVLMRVNEQWVHESQNDLFASLENGERVSVVLVRKGLPVHLVYMIRD